VSIRLRSANQGDGATVVVFVRPGLSWAGLNSAWLTKRSALATLEKGGVNSRVSTVLAIQKALAKAGIEFLDADQKGEGGRLRSPRA
jgi:hypothetical protein